LVDESAEPLGVMLFEMQWIRSVTRAAPEHLAVVRVDGDSMRDTLADGDWVLIDRTQTRINREGIYALRIGDACWIKRISLNLRDRLVAIISDNQNYRVQELPEEDLAIIGRVVWIVGRKI
jgi:phage repressor protein C with HTH and peptisase S24 domain